MFGKSPDHPRPHSSGVSRFRVVREYLSAVGSLISIALITGWIIVRGYPGILVLLATLAISGLATWGIATKLRKRYSLPEIKTVTLVVAFAGIGSIGAILLLALFVVGIPGQLSYQAPPIGPTTLPPFPIWEPPEASASYVLPNGFMKGNLTFGSALLALQNALQEAGYSDYSYFSIPSGFAILTRLERIEPDGYSLARSLE